MKLGLICALPLLAMCSTNAALADDGQTLAAKFGTLASVNAIALSPDGSHVSFVSPLPGGGQVLYVADLTSGTAPKAILSETNKLEKLYGCEWATNDRLVCTIGGIVEEAGVFVGFDRKMVLNSDGSKLTMLSRGGRANSIGYAQGGGSIIDWNLPGKPGHVLMTQHRGEEMTSGTNIGGGGGERLGVDDVDVVTLAHKIVEPPKNEADQFMSDGRGNVRIMGSAVRDNQGMLAARARYYYRKQGQRSWEPLSLVESNDKGVFTGFDPYAIDPDKNIAYGFDDKEGFQALYSLSLDGNMTKSLILSRPDTDVDWLVRIGANQRVVGASYATERRTIEFFDPELKKLGAALTKALPGNPDIYFVDSSADESKLLMFATSDTIPGTVYLFDKQTRKLAQVVTVRPQLDGIAMGTMKPITYAAADGTKIPGYLTLPPGSSGKGLPAIVMPHGGPSSRDEWGFDWMVQFFTSRGFAVLQPNFRGSSGYGADFYKRNGFQSWRTAIGDVNDAGHWLVSEGIAAPGKLAVFGWSYGGYAALQSSVLDPDLFKAIVAVAPVTDLEHLKQESKSYTSAKIVSQFIGNGPHVKEGSPAQNVDRIKAPVLMFHGDKDSNVAVAESRFMAGKLREAGKQVDYVEFPGLDHQLDDSTARTLLLSKSDAFIRKVLGL